MAKRDRTAKHVSRKRLEQLVRQFKENGVKLLLEHPENVRELIGILSGSWRDRIDFDRMGLVKTTFIRRDFRHVESDVVLTAPLLDRRGRRTRKKLLIYVLIEHQSEPDRLMPLRILDYVVQIFNFQLRQWTRSHDSASTVRLQPVLPIVFYTGTRHWKSPGVLTDLVESGDQFRDITPLLQPLYVNLPELSAETLDETGGDFGCVLRVIQQRKARPREFEQLLEQVVKRLELMPDEQRSRWLDLLSYLHALVYHERQSAEHKALTRAIERSVESDDHRQEVFNMSQTIADELIEKGMQKGEQKGKLNSLQQILSLQLRERFGEQAEAVAALVERTKDVAQLERWLKQFATATTLEELKIG
jgi:hypothetical protein